MTQDEFYQQLIETQTTPQNNKSIHNYSQIENFLGSEDFLNLYLNNKKARSTSRFKLIRAMEIFNYGVFFWLFLLTFIFRYSHFVPVLGFLGGFVSLILREVKHEGVLKESETEIFKYMTRERLQYFLQSYIQTNKERDPNVRNPSLYYSLLEAHKKQNFTFPEKMLKFMSGYFHKTPVRLQFSWMSKSKKQELLKLYEFDKIISGLVELPSNMTISGAPPQFWQKPDMTREQTIEMLKQWKMVEHIQPSTNTSHNASNTHSHEKDISAITDRNDLNAIPRATEAQWIDQNPRAHADSNIKGNISNQLDNFAKTPQKQKYLYQK